MNFATAEGLLSRGRNGTKKLANNTYLHKLNENEIAVRFHATNIIVIHKDDSCNLNTGGWQTSTTKNRLNEFSPANIFQKNGVWYLATDGSSFYDGMRIDSYGKPLAKDAKDPDEISAKKRKLDKMVSSYIEGFVTDVAGAKSLNECGSGDCWGCLMKDVKENRELQPIGERQVMGVSHFFEHFKEKYYVPSIVRNAILEARYNNPGFILGMIKGDAEQGRVDMLKCILISYFRKLKPELLKEMT